jgi:CRP-like cAMP-binding protein
LRQVPLFSHCSDKELKQIVGLGTPATVPSGRELTKPGQHGREFFILLSGKARCLLGDKEVATFGPGDFFGEMALLDGKPRSATVTTEGEVEALVLDSREFRRLVEVSPALALKMLESIAGRLREADISIQT